MKNTIILLLLISFISVSTFSQNSSIAYKKGDVFIIKNVENNNYKHIHFPRANFIIKKGGVPNFKNLYGEKIEIVSTKENKDGDIIATIKLVSGKRFFNSHKFLTANIKAALKEQELIRE